MKNQRKVRRSASQKKGAREDWSARSQIWSLTASAAAASDATSLLEDMFGAIGSSNKLTNPSGSVTLDAGGDGAPTASVLMPSAEEEATAPKTPATGLAPAAAPQAPVPQSAAATVAQAQAQENTLTKVFGTAQRTGIEAEGMAAATDVKAEHLLKCTGSVGHVWVRMTIMHISRIDVQNQCFEAKLRIHSRWKCPEKDVDDARLRVGQLDVSWVPSWHPLLTVRHTVSRTEMSCIYLVEEEDAGGGSEATPGFFAFGGGSAAGLWIRCRSVITVVVDDKLDLRAFPFDIQDFSLVLVCDNAPHLGILDDDEETTSSAAMLDAAGLEMADMRLFRPLPAIYRLHPGTAIRGADAEESAANALMRRMSRRRGGAPTLVSTPELRVVIFLERKVSGFVVNFYLVLFLISSCVLGAWAVHWSDVGTRLGFDVTLLLVAVSFKQIAEQMSPPVSYLTLLDYYSLFAIFFLLLALGFHAVIGFNIFDCDTISGQCRPRAGALGFRAIDENFGDVDANGASSTVGIDGYMARQSVLDRASLLTFAAAWLLGNVVYVMYSLRVSNWLKSHITPSNTAALGFKPVMFAPPRLQWWTHLTTGEERDGPAGNAMLQYLGRSAITAQRISTDTTAPGAETAALGAESMTA